MKLLLLTVSVIAVFDANCRNFPDLPDSVNGAQNLPDEDHDSANEDQYVNNEPGNYDSADEDKYAPAELESHGSSKNVQQLKKRSLHVTHKSKDPQDMDSAKEKQDLEKENEGPNGRKIRRSRCKARNACVVMAGFCVTNATLCSGRLVPEGCKGTDCQCCVPGTLENKIHDLENEIQSMQTNLNGTKLNMNMTLKLMEDKIMDSISNISSKLDYYMEHAGCPQGFFTAGSRQCFKNFNTTNLSWTSAKAKCQTEGLLLAKPNDPVGLRNYLQDYNSGSNKWIGGRGAGSYLKWDRDGQQISNTNSLWYPSEPGSGVSTSYCLSMHSSSSSPNQPYISQPCSNARPFVCERVMN